MFAALLLGVLIAIFFAQIAILTVLLDIRRNQESATPETSASIEWSEPQEQ